MRHRLILAVAAILCGSGAPAATRTYTVTSFDRVRVEGPFQVTIQSGRGSSARAEGPDSRMLERVRLEVVGRTLVIRRDRDTLPGGSLAGIRIVATTPALMSAAVMGSGTLSVEAVRSARFDASVSGTGGLEVASIDADSVTISATGNGRAKFAGRARQVRGLIQGAGTIDGSGLAADDVAVTSAGASDVTLAARRSAKVVASGSGRVVILGTPACTVTSEGSVEVSCAGPPRR
jgi:hypothetical protein